MEGEEVGGTKIWKVNKTDREGWCRCMRAPTDDTSVVGRFSHVCSLRPPNPRRRFDSIKNGSGESRRQIKLNDARDGLHERPNIGHDDHPIDELRIQVVLPSIRLGMPSNVHFKLTWSKLN